MVGMWSKTDKQKRIEKRKKNGVRAMKERRKGDAGREKKGTDRGRSWLVFKGTGNNTRDVAVIKRSGFLVRVEAVQKKGVVLVDDRVERS